MKLVLAAAVLPSLAFAESRVSLAAMLADPLSEASLMHLESELAKEASTSSKGARQTPLFGELARMINDTMAPNILTAHDEAQSQLDAFRAAFEACGKPDVPSKGDFKGITTKAIADKLEEHRQCRAKEGAATTAAETCSTTLAKEETVKDAACKAVPGSDGTPPSLDKDGHVGCKVTDGDYEGWLNSFDSQIQQLKDQYDQHSSGCGNASKLVDDLIPKCQAANASVGANKTVCDGLQIAADGMGCVADPTAHAACTSYQECYDKAKENYVNANESIVEAQVNRTVQWRVLKRMQCLLAEEAMGATHEGIDACREENVSTSHLDLVYPEVPERIDCAHVVGGPQPCSEEWLELYGEIPHNAPASPCTPCPAPLVVQLQKRDAMCTNTDQSLLAAFQNTKEMETAQKCGELVARTEGCGPWFWHADSWQLTGRKGCHCVPKSNGPCKVHAPGAEVAGWGLNVYTTETVVHLQKRDAMCTNTDQSLLAAFQNTEEMETAKKCGELVARTEGCGPWFWHADSWQLTGRKGCHCVPVSNGPCKVYAPGAEVAGWGLNVYTTVAQ